MMTAQQWNQQQSYNRHGLDMRPKTAERSSGAEITASDKKKLFMLVLIAGLLCITMVIVSAYVASMNYQNNKLKESNKALQSEVQTLQVKVKSASGIAAVADKATGKLGMVYPSGKKYVKLTTADKPSSDLASLLKKQAYN